MSNEFTPQFFEQSRLAWRANKVHLCNGLFCYANDSKLQFKVMAAVHKIRSYKPHRPASISDQEKAFPSD